MNLFRPLWFTGKGKDGYDGGGGYLQIKIFYFLSTKKHRQNGKSTGKMQRKHREFGIIWNVATLILVYSWLIVDCAKSCCHLHKKKFTEVVNFDEKHLAIKVEEICSNLLPRFV